MRSRLVFTYPPDDEHRVARWVGRPVRETEVSRADEAVTALTHDAFRSGFCYRLLWQARCRVRPPHAALRKRTQLAFMMASTSGSEYPLLRSKSAIC